MLVPHFVPWAVFQCCFTTKRRERYRSLETATSFKIRERQSHTVKMGHHLHHDLHKEEHDPIEGTLTYDMQKDLRYSDALRIIDELGIAGQIKQRVQKGLSDGLKGLIVGKHL